MAEIKSFQVKYDPNYPYFGLVKGPFPKPRHPNQRDGLDKGVEVVNFKTGEVCIKKLYAGTKGLHFKHTGFSPTYLKDMVENGVVYPFQVFLA